MKHLLSCLLALATFCISAPSVLAVSVVHITLAPGWNTFATPQHLSEIAFSNDGEGLAFYTLEGGSWSSQTVVPTVANVRPLEGFMVYNGNQDSVHVSLTCREADADDLLHQKSLPMGWNLVGMAHEDFAVNPVRYTTVGGAQVMNYIGGDYASLADFTSANFADTSDVSNAAAGIRTVTAADVADISLQEFKAYAIFVNADNKVHGGTQAQVEAEDVHIYAETDGQNAFDLTEKFADITYDAYDFGNFITSINGLAGDNSHFWSLYVNGELSQVGASDVTLSKGDKVSWLYTEF